MLKMHSDRLSNGVWDNNPHKSTTEIEDLENQLKDLKVAVEKSQRIVDGVRKEMHWEGEEKEMVKAWRTDLQRNIDRVSRDIKWFEEEGKQYAEEQELKKLEKEIEDLKRRLENAENLPKTAEEAIKPH